MNMNMNKGTSNFMVMHGDNSDISQTMMDNYVSKNFKWCLSNLELLGITEFIDTVTKLNNEETLKKYKAAGTYKYFIEILFDGCHKPIFMNVFNYGGEKFYLDLFSDTKHDLEIAYNELEKFMKEESKTQINKTTFYIGQSLESKVEVLKPDDFKDIISEYYPEFISVDDFIIQFMKSSESIFILSGGPGTGKTKFFSYIMKFLLGNPQYLKANKENLDIGDENKILQVAYLQDERVLAMDQFWITLSERGYDLVILDDLDGYLEPRSNDITSEEDMKKNMFVSQLLSFSDGVVKNKTKFLISTNRDIDSVDKALLRPGRLFGIYEFSFLTNEDALKIWLIEGLTKTAFKKEFPARGESISQAKLASVIENYKINDGKDKKTFIKDGSTMDIQFKVTGSKVGFSFPHNAR